MVERRVGRGARLVAVGLAVALGAAPVSAVAGSSGGEPAAGPGPGDAEPGREDIGELWQQAQARNAQEISELGRELYKRLATLAEHWGKVGKGLNQAMEYYNKATATLESRVLVQARRFRELHAAPEGAEIALLEPLDHSARTLQAIEMQQEEPEAPASD